MICRKLYKDGLTLTCSAFRILHGDKSSVQGCQCYVLNRVSKKNTFFGKITVYGIDNTDISECILIYQKYWFSSNSLLKFQFTVPSQNPTNHPKSLILTHYFWWTKMKTVNVCLIQRLQKFKIYSGITIKVWKCYHSFVTFRYRDLYMFKCTINCTWWCFVRTRVLKFRQLWPRSPWPIVLACLNFWPTILPPAPPWWTNLALCVIFCTLGESYFAHGPKLRVHREKFNINFFAQTFFW